MSWAKYTDWYRNHRFKAKFYDLFDKKKGEFKKSGVMATYKNFSLYLVKRDIVKDNYCYTEFRIIKPNGEKTENYLYSGSLDMVILDDDFTDRVKEIIKEDKKKGIIYNTETMLDNVDNITDEKCKTYKAGYNLQKNFWKWLILEWLESQVKLGKKAKYSYQISAKDVNKIAEELSSNDRIYQYLQSNILITDYLKKYERSA